MGIFSVKEVIEGFVAPASAAYKAKQDKAKEIRVAEIHSDVTRLQANARAVEAGIKSDENWAMASIKNSSWKDELWSVCFAYVFLSSFVPKLQDYTQAGVTQIAAYPPWFQFLLSSVVLASFGIKYLGKQR